MSKLVPGSQKIEIAQRKCLDRYLIIFGPTWQTASLTKWPKIQLLAHSSSSTMLTSFAKLSSMRIVLQTFFYWYVSVTLRLRQVLGTWNFYAQIVGYFAILLTRLGWIILIAYRWYVFHYRQQFPVVFTTYVSDLFEIFIITIDWTASTN